MVKYRSVKADGHCLSASESGVSSTQLATQKIERLTSFLFGTEHRSLGWMFGPGQGCEAQGCKAGHILIPQRFERSPEHKCAVDGENGCIFTAVDLESATARGT